ncbi:MAG: rRNA maturation RNase YbeY [Chloroflexi bacterium]|nr:rRNA maturation RNase YbeY [Chloroflexota bacterium]MCY3959756.1 rRNA maturation RNase YbeY [Chloroflexota bacterium]
MPSLANSSAAADPPAPADGATCLRIHVGEGIPLPRGLARLIDPIAAAVHDSTGLTGVVALRLTDDAEMSRLNGAFAGQPSATDVLAFSSGDPEHPGDIAMSLERVRSQALALGHGIEREFGYLLTHGLLHLAGFGHDDDAAQRQMRRVEETVMAAVGLLRDHKPVR